MAFLCQEGSVNRKTPKRSKVYQMYYTKRLRRNPTDLKGWNMGGLGEKRLEYKE